MEPAGALTVSQLTEMIKGTLEAAFPPFWLEGEISSLRSSPNGHFYFSLKDPGASISCVLFRYAAGRLPFMPEEGGQVLLFGRLSVYQARGQYQLVVERMEPRGLGAQRLAMEQLRARLAAEGLFDPERKQPLPPYPLTVGVVTSPSGAALHDILQVLRKRGTGVRVLLAPALVQGEGAAESIVQAIGLQVEAGQADLLIVGRGGGSYEDLAAFSREEVVRAVASCPLPVVSAVGHETDVSLADLAADLRAPTPSAAAEMVARSRDEHTALLRHSTTRLTTAAGRILREGRRRLAETGGRLVHPRMALEQSRMRLDDQLFRLQASLRTSLEGRRARLAGLGELLDSLGPRAVLGRGYAILRRADGSVVRHPGEVRGGERLTALLAGGSLGLVVEEEQQE